MHTQTQRTAGNPNLLFIMTDHQRADSIGMVQVGVEVTPHLNRLAKTGVHFTRAYNTSPLCVPARTALATGVYPTTNGVVFNDWKGLRAGDHVPIHQILADAGYGVAHIGVDHIRVKPTLPERVQFAKWIGNAEHDQYLAAQHITNPTTEQRNTFKREITENQNGVHVPVSYSNTHCAIWNGPAEHFKDSYFCQQAVDFLQTSGERPFALFVYLWAPHPPLWVPQPYASQFPPDALDLPENVNQIASGEPANRRRGIAAQLAEGISISEWREVWAAHLGLVHLADAGIGQVLHALENTGKTDDTVVVFASDHGDHLGQHRMYQKMEMYKPAIRVPLIVRAPGCLPQCVDTPVSHLDVMPTTLELLGIETPTGLDGDSLHNTIVSGTPPPDKPGVLGDQEKHEIRHVYRITRTGKDLAQIEHGLEGMMFSTTGCHGGSGIQNWRMDFTFQKRLVRQKLADNG
ncbi:MAG: sulfatase-like hydrolase/transferase [Candidatus Poribacteria bacterium]|nr:sulfatase-like hydrolase/transferase [Candidatus Poribacteria bacterium]